MYVCLATSWKQRLLQIPPPTTVNNSLFSEVVSVPVPTPPTLTRPPNPKRHLESSSKARLVYFILDGKAQQCTFFLNNCSLLASPGSLDHAGKG